MIIHLFLSLTGICQQFSIVVTKNGKDTWRAKFPCLHTKSSNFCNIEAALNLNLTQHGVKLGALII